MEIHLVSFFGQVNENQQFASKKQLETRQVTLNKTAVEFGGVSKCHSWTLDRLKATQYYKDNKELLSRPRGCGYWAWKPYIILETLRTIPKGSYVIYCDIGKPYEGVSEDFGNQITGSLLPIAEWADQNNGIFPGVYLSHHGAASQWIKADCFELMGCTDPKYKSMPTIQAGYTAWKNTPEVIQFLEKWKVLNLDPRLISDDENTQGVANTSDFIRNCHDQATLTLLCEKEGVKAFGDRRQQFWGFRNINFIAKSASLELKGLQESLLFAGLNNQYKLLPRFLNRWVELIFCDKYLDNLNVLLLNAKNEKQWQEYFPSSKITNKSKIVGNGLYDFINTHSLDEEGYTPESVFDIFNALKEGGLAIIGPFSEETDVLRYCRQLAKKEKFFPIEGLGIENLPKHDLKIHNSKNPIFVSSKKESYVLLYKPHKILN